MAVLMASKVISDFHTGAAKTECSNNASLGSWCYLGYLDHISPITSTRSDQEASGGDRAAVSTYRLTLYSRLQFSWTDQILLSSIGMDTIPNTMQLRKLDLLANTVKESMRMYHPLGLNIREARTDATLPVGGGPDGKDPVSVSAGQIIGELWIE